MFWFKKKKVKLCINCKHCGRYIAMNACEYIPCDRFSLVDGKQIVPPEIACSLMRRNSFFDITCGTKGRFYEEKKEVKNGTANTSD
jgi:hypothetical protein